MLEFETSPSSAEIAAELEFYELLHTLDGKLQEALARQLQNPGYYFVLTDTHPVTADSMAEFCLAEEPDLSSRRSISEVLEISIPVQGVDYSSMRGLAKENGYFMFSSYDAKQPHEASSIRVIDRDAYVGAATEGHLDELLSPDLSFKLHATYKAAAIRSKQG